MGTKVRGRYWGEEVEINEMGFVNWVAVTETIEICLCQRTGQFFSDSRGSVKRKKLCEWTT